MKKKTVNQIKILLISTILMGACGNTDSYYVDINNQSLNACGKNGISSVIISNDSLNFIYTLEWRENALDAPLKINFNNIPDGYIITSGWKKKAINTKSIPFVNYGKYQIKIPRGDVSALKIDILTDQNGKIAKTSNSQCK